MRRVVLAIVVVVLVGLCVGLGVYLSRPKPPEPTTSVVRHQIPQAEEHRTKEVKVYQVVVENNQPRLQATKETIASDGKPIENAMRKLVEQGSGGGLTNPIPKGTKLLGVNVKDGLAKVDFSREFRDNFTGGSEGEALVIGVILRTLSQFDEVKKVQFLVEGKPIESLGHAPLSEPLDVGWVSPEFNEKE
jgi:spore germination protein GerM